MNEHEIQRRAAMLGMSAWTVEAVAVGREGSETATLCCIGFRNAGIPVAEAETWEEAWAEAVRIAFGA